MFLNKEELKALTKALQPSRMINWLKSEGFIFKVGLDGYPVVLREHVLQIMGSQELRTRKKPQVDLSWQRQNPTAA